MTNQPTDLLNMSEAARLMGMEPEALRVRVRKGGFPSVAIPGGPPKIRRSDVEKYINPLPIGGDRPKPMPPD